jgi:hypothetical protein
MTVIDNQSVHSEEPEQAIIPQKLSIRQYLDEALMPTLLPALNELVK